MSTPFAWEEEYKRTWEEKSAREEAEKPREKIIRDTKPLKKGLIRHFHVILDQSEKIDSDGYLPSFRYNLVKALAPFIKAFYQENPISILSFLLSSDEISQKYFLADHRLNINEMLGKLGKGYFSLEGALEESILHIKNSVYLREILIITPSTTIRNSAYLDKTFNELRALNIKVHCINLCAEIQVFKSLSEITNGIHRVPMNYDHFKLFLDDFCVPKPISLGQRVTLLKFGFPETIYERSFCACHLELTEYGYVCVVCSTKVCSLPIKCPICDTQLVSLANLSKSIHHQYPLAKFKRKDDSLCHVCRKRGFSLCEKCKTSFCTSCDTFVHDVLNICPFCR